MVNIVKFIMNWATQTFLCLAALLFNSTCVKAQTLNWESNQLGHINSDFRSQVEGLAATGRQFAFIDFSDYAYVSPVSSQLEEYRVTLFYQSNASIISDHSPLDDLQDQVTMFLAGSFGYYIHNTTLGTSLYSKLWEENSIILVTDKNWQTNTFDPPTPGSDILLAYVAQSTVNLDAWIDLTWRNEPTTLGDRIDVSLLTSPEAVFWLTGGDNDEYFYELRPGAVANFNPLVPVPEPSGALLVGIAGALGMLHRRRVARATIQKTT
jgi:hypothetical protein